MDADLINAVRRFNRAVTQRVGALENSYLRRGRPLGEARMLHEIGPDGAEVRALRERLGLDSGYTSRLLRSLEQQGLVTMHADPGDGRVRRATLTRSGRAEFRAYERGSDALAEAILAPLTEARRHRLVAAMSEVERLLRAANIDIQVEQPTGHDARWCLDAYFKELEARFESDFEAARRSAAHDNELVPPKGYFLVARRDGKPIGCGALMVIDARVGEIKRLWTAPDARGLGCARQVLERLETIARELGMTMVRLDTNAALHEARALYHGSAYYEVEPFNEEPYSHHWFAKQL